MTTLPVEVDDTTLQWLLEVSSQRPSVIPRLPASKNLRLVGVVQPVDGPGSAYLVESVADVDELLRVHHGVPTLWWVVPASTILELVN